MASSGSGSDCGSGACHVSPDCTAEHSTAHDAVADITIIHFLLEGTNLTPSLRADTAWPDGCNINTNQVRSLHCLPPHGKYSILEDN